MPNLTEKNSSGNFCMNKYVDILSMLLAGQSVSSMLLVPIGTDQQVSGNSPQSFRFMLT